MLTEIDHVAIAVRDLDAAVAWYESASSGARVVHRERVESDGVDEALIAVADSYIQLLTPTGPDSPVARFLERRGEGLHHVGYRVDDCAAALESRARERGAGDRRGAAPGLTRHAVAFVHPSARLRHAGRARPGGSYRAVGVDAANSFGRGRAASVALIGHGALDVGAAGPAGGAQARGGDTPAASGPSSATTRKGKLTARERIEYLLDEGSFSELDMLNRHSASGMGLEETRPYTDGVITGFGTIDGRKVCVFSQDFTVFGGALGETHGEKIHKIMDLADDDGPADHRAQRRRRRANPGGRRRAATPTAGSSCATPGPRASCPRSR